MSAAAAITTRSSAHLSMADKPVHRQPPLGQAERGYSPGSLIVTLAVAAIWSVFQ